MIEKNRILSLCPSAGLWKSSQITFLVFSLLLVSFAGWRSINYLTPKAQEHDDAIYAAGGLHLAKGKILYKEFFDHKPPGIFVINALALGIGDGSVTAIRQMERLWATAAALLFSMLVLMMYRRLLLILPATFLFLMTFYRPKLFYLGNYTEEYAAIFVLGGIAASLMSKSATGRKTYFFAGAAGFIFSLAALTKEPFLLSAVPWFFYIVIRRKSGYRGPVYAGTAFVAGFIIPLGLFAGYLLYNGAGRDWWDSFLLNFAYMKWKTGNATLLAKIASLPENFAPASEYVFDASVIGKLACLLGLVAACHNGFVKEHRGLPWIILAAVLLDFFASGLRGPRGLHYCLQLAPSYVLLATTGAAFLFYMFKERIFSQAALIFLLMLGVSLLDGKNAAAYAKQLAKPFSRAPLDAISRAMRANARPGDTMWISHSLLTHYYVETGLLSPVKIAYPFRNFVFLDTAICTGVQRRNEILEEIYRNPPTFLVGMPTAPEKEFFANTKFSQWIDEHYFSTGIFGAANNKQNTLYIRKDAEQASVLTAVGAAASYSSP